MPPKRKSAPSPLKPRSPTSPTAASLPPDAPDPNIFLWAPNLVGYVRIVLACVSLTFMSYHPRYCTFAYFISCMLDAVDGHVARMLGQSSRFGAVLDMVTDRCTTSCLLCFLSSAYPPYALLFQGLIALDFASHYMHMYSSLTSGSRSHKRVSKEQSWLLHSYYTDNRTLFTVCFLNETFFVCLYLMKWYTRPLGLDPVLIFRPLPVSVIKLIPMSSYGLIRRATWPAVVAALTCPGSALKQFLNIVQIIKAAKQLNSLDIEEWRARGRAL